MRGVRWSNARCVKRPCPPSTQTTPPTRAPRWAKHLRPRETSNPPPLACHPPSSSLPPPPGALHWDSAVALACHRGRARNGRCCCWGWHAGRPVLRRIIHRGSYIRGIHHATHLPTPLGPDAKTRCGASAPATARPPTAWTPARHSKREAETVCGGGQAGQGSLPDEGEGAVLDAAALLREGEPSPAFHV